MDICHMALQSEAIKNHTKSRAKNQIRHGTDQLATSETKAVNRRPHLSVITPPNRQHRTWATMPSERISPICSSLHPFSYIYSEANGVTSA